MNRLRQMSETAGSTLKPLRKPKIEPFWIIILAWSLGMLVLFGYHLWTRQMPAAEAFYLLDLPVYWYGILIVSGIGLGAYVISRLSWERWRSAFLANVSPDLMDLPVTAVSFPESLQTKLNKQDVSTVGHLLLIWGTDPRSLRLKNDEREAVEAAFRETSRN